MSLSSSTEEMCRPFQAGQNYLALMFKRPAQVRAEAHYRLMPLL